MISKTRDTEPIIAQCTPSGQGALALIRLSGPGSFDCAQSIAHFASGESIMGVQSHTIHYGAIKAKDGTILDHVMFFVMKGPRTFTGQDTLEITCHNNPFIIDSIIQQCIENGARRAEPGEFARRAFVQGKIDLVQAEAIYELIHASNHQVLKQSLAQLEGSFSHWINSLQEKLLSCLALSEASFEFIDEEDLQFGTRIIEQINDILNSLQTIKTSFDQKQTIREGIRIAFIGAVNAGKSSLFNALYKKDRAIVTDQAGTTRDSIEGGMYQDGFYVTLVDTAGLRMTDDIIEAEGIKRSFQEAQKADIILLIYDQSRLFTEHEQNVYQELYTKYSHKTVALANKSDLPIQQPKLEWLKAIHAVSIKDINSVEEIRVMIKQKMDELLNKAQAPFLLNQRHFHVLKTVEQKLNVILELCNNDFEYELISFHLKDALETLSELTGKSISEQAMDKIFREFCVGK